MQRISKIINNPRSFITSSNYVIAQSVPPPIKKRPANRAFFIVDQVRHQHHRFHRPLVYGEGGGFVRADHAELIDLQQQRRFGRFDDAHHIVDMIQLGVASASDRHARGGVQEKARLSRALSDLILSKPLRR